MHIVVSFGEVVEINTSSLQIDTEEDKGDYRVWKDKKWYKFCKDHNFHPIKDAYGRIYQLYLQLCAEGII